MRDIWNLGLKLFAITAVAGLLLGFTNAITKGPIAEQEIAAANAARQQVLPEAAEFVKLENTPDGMDEAYAGFSADGTCVGLTGKLIANGYGGEIEVTVGVGVDGVITGVNVGGANFAETAGLGAKTKDAAFTGQFAGKSAPLTLKKNGGEIDAVTSATISSNAVTTAVSQTAATLSGVELPNNPTEAVSK